MQCIPTWPADSQWWLPGFSWLKIYTFAILDSRCNFLTTSFGFRSLPNDIQASRELILPMWLHKVLLYATQLKNYWNNWLITISDAIREFQDHRDLSFSDVRLLNTNILRFSWNVHRMHLGWWCLNNTSWFLYACLPIWLSTILFKYSQHIMYM